MLTAWVGRGRSGAYSMGPCYVATRLCDISRCVEGLRCEILGFCSSAVDVDVPIFLGYDAASLGDCCLMFWDIITVSESWAPFTQRHSTISIQSKEIFLATNMCFCVQKKLNYSAVSSHPLFFLILSECKSIGVIGIVMYNNNNNNNNNNNTLLEFSSLNTRVFLVINFGCDGVSPSLFCTDAVIVTFTSVLLSNLYLILYRVIEKDGRDLKPL